jgi:dethiobiotin synthetase
MKRFVVSGIGTDVGKTVASAIISEALEANYWKPVQAGDLEWSDSKKVAHWTTKVTILPERFCLRTPASPHYAAAVDGITISPSDFQIPESDRNLVIEGAGGLMVPLNNEGLLYIDLFEKWQVPVILVSRHYLGSINHTLLSVDALQKRSIPIAGILFIGDENKATEEIISAITKVKILGRIPFTEEINAKFIQEQAAEYKHLEEKL